MPLPWRKTKIERVSRFVADIRSSNRGESLVVQTGFPTSLIDLFVKNQDRLKKPSSKKKHQHSSEISANSTPSPRICTPELNSLDSTRFQVPSPSAINNNTETKIGKEICPLVVGNNAEEDIVEVSVPNRAFMRVLKLSLVLVLALATKKLTIGITVSAFLLLFLEFAGTRLFRFFNPCLDARMSLNSVVESVLGSVPLETSSVDNKFSSTEYCGSLNNEIQIIEPDLKNLIPSERRFESSELEQKKMRMLGKDEDAIEDANFANRKRTKSSTKIKAKLLKKFVLRTFRGGSKKISKNSKEPLPDSESIVSDYIGEEEELIRVEEELEEDEQGELEERGKEIDEMYNSSEVSQVGLNTDVGDNVGRTRNGRLGHLIPFVIILAGLIGGRVIALVLTIAWCLLQKIRANFGVNLQGDPNQVSLPRKKIGI